MNYIVSKMSDKDKSLFLEAMQSMDGMTPIKPDERKPSHDSQNQQAQSAKLLKKIKSKQRKQQYELEDSIVNKRFDFSGEKVGSFDQLYYCQTGVRTQELTKLKKSDFKVEASLDLHGFTVSDAEQEIDDFIALCHAHNKRYIRIIHGIGYNSDDEHPAIKNLTNQMLSQFSEVIAFTSTPEKDGGVGAVNILLKAQ